MTKQGAVLALFAIWWLTAPVGIWPLRAHAVHAETPRAELLSYRLIMRCLPSHLLDIGWTTAVEENVAGYKVHRLSLDGQQPPGWVNPVPIAARGPGDYRLIDSDVAAGRRYLYRLYVFDETYQLSRAQQIVLANPAHLTCAYAPLVHRG